MKTKLEFIVSVTVDHPKSWSRKEILAKGKETIGRNSLMGTDGTESYRAKTNSVKPVGSP